MKKMINKVTVEGLVYESKLATKVSKNGKEYIGGELFILTSEDNVVPVNFFEFKMTNAGAENKKYADLLKLMSTMKTVLVDGKENATPLSIKSSNLTADEYSKDEQVRSFAKQQGGFINVVPATKLNPKATFENDVMIVNTIREIDPVSGEERPYLTVKAFIFNWANEIIPMTFAVHNPKGIEYFENMAPNTFTKVWGNIVSLTVKTQKITENAFGEALVEEVERTTKQWVITGTNTIAYDEEQMTVEEWQKCLANRQLKIADYIKAEKDRAMMKAQSQGQINTAPAQGANNNGFGGFAAATPAGGFNF